MKSRTIDPCQGRAAWEALPHPARRWHFHPGARAGSGEPANLTEENRYEAGDGDRIEGGRRKRGHKAHAADIPEAHEIDRVRCPGRSGP